MSDRAWSLLGWLLSTFLIGFTLLGLELPVGDGDESYHALILTHMLRSGDYLHSYWQGGLALQRPELPYWLAAPFTILLGGEIGMRMSSALCSIGTLVVVHRTAQRSWGRRDAAWLATLLLAGAASFHVYSRTLMSDPPFVLATTIALAGSLDHARPQRALYSTAAGLGLALATKSFAAAIPAVGLLPGIWRATRATGLRGLRGPILVALALSLPYYALGFALHGRVFWQEHFLANLFQRATSGFGLGMPGGVLAYTRWIPFADGVVGAFWLALGSAGAFVVGLLRRDASLSLAGGYASIVFVLMSMMAMRLPHYVLPVYPAAALGAAGLWVHGTSALGPRVEWLRGLAVVLGLAVQLVAVRQSAAASYLMPRPYGKALGLAAKAQLPPGLPLYAYEWYGPSLALYSERRTFLMTADRARYESIQHDAIVRAGVTRLVPPAPMPVGSVLYIAGPPAALLAARWLTVEEAFAQSGPFVLVRARVNAER